MNFDSQICTTEEQSKRLLALGLKKETADMHYHCIVCNEYPEYILMLGYPKIPLDTPAWSLHRLIELAEVSVEVSGIWIRISGAYRYEEKDNAYDNLIDAIADLINNDVFNKKYLEE